MKVWGGVKGVGQSVNIKEKEIEDTKIIRSLYPSRRHQENHNRGLALGFDHFVIIYYALICIHLHRSLYFSSYVPTTGGDMEWGWAQELVPLRRFR
jgi:hypothetical protein